VSISDALGALSDETLAALARQEQLENAQARQEWRERKAAIRAKQEDQQALVRLGLRTVRSPSQVLGAYVAEIDVDANASRCRAVFEHWLQNGGQAEELKGLLGHQASLDRARHQQQLTQTRRRATEAEARRGDLEQRVMQLERENAGLRYRAERLEAAVGSLGG
jgi:hypothetical protein